MERLTRRNEHGEDSFLVCNSKDGCGVNCAAYDPCRVEQMALDRLAAYEDTELSPEICSEYKMFEDEAISKNVTFNHIVELMDSEAEGRLLILPCKMFDTVYMVVEKRARVSSKSEFRFVKKSQMTWNNLHRVLEDFGKTVFLTEEEAVAAVNRMNDGAK